MRTHVTTEIHGFRLARRDLVSLEGRPGIELQVHRGLVWLTQHDDTRDIVIQPGSSFRLDRNGKALLEALADTEISLLTPHSA